MADDDQRTAAAVEFAFQPFDGGEIEMVGGLVQQQDIGRGRQHARQRGAAGLAAGQVRGIFVAVQPELLQQIAGLVVVVARAEAGFDIGQRGREAGKIGLLRQIADGRAGLHEAAAAVGLDEAGRDLQQRRFAGAVAADQADALARRHRQFDARQQRRAAEGQLDVFQLDQRRRHRFWFNSGFARIALRAGAGCGGWPDRARDRNAERSRGANDLGPPVDFARGAQIGHQIANRERHPDRLFGKRLAVRRDHLGAGLHAAARQRDVGGDHDIAFSGAFRDPVIGGVHPGTGRDALDQRIRRHPNEVPRDHADGKAMTGRDPVDFVLHRAGIGVDIDAGGVQIWRHRLRELTGYAARSRERKGSPGMRVVPHRRRNCEENTAGPTLLPRPFLRVPLAMKR